MSDASFFIKPFEKYHLDEVHKLIEQTILLNYPEIYCSDVVNFFLEYHTQSNIELKSKKGDILVGCIKDKIVGVGYLIEKEIGGLYVHTDFQRNGYGEKIVLQLIELARLKNLDYVWLHSTPTARNFYLNLGFEMQEELTDIVGPRDAPLPYFLMKMELK
jgi:GNAT superfamily N-acetyltransferase